MKLAAKPGHRDSCIDENHSFLGACKGSGPPGLPLIRLCLFWECGAFPPLFFFSFSKKNKKNKAAEKRRTPKKGKAASDLG
jgi:hypothetical protein